jgi:glycosyltransferase involved in cell wall biosynthesis
MHPSTSEPGSSDRSATEGVRTGGSGSREFAATDAQVHPTGSKQDPGSAVDPQTQHPRFSVVIPLFNEEESLRELTERLHVTLHKMAGDRYEIIYVDDGSRDNSYNVIRQLHDQNPLVRAIRFRTNFGKAAALSVGFDNARGDIVFTMDADLQDDPSELPRLLEKLESGYDLISGWKQVRHDPWHKTLPSKLFNRVVQKVTKLDIHDFNCGLKVYRREVLPHLRVYGEMHRYLPAQAHWQGFRVGELPVQHHPRRHGVSKYGMSRLLKGFLDLLTLLLTNRYATRPLHVFGTIGVLVAFAGFCIDLWLMIEKLLGLTDLSNRPLTLLGVLMIIVGVQLISIGLIGEMIAKNSLSNQQYSIREILG